jgi:hypothetical protein
VNNVYYTWLCASVFYNDVEYKKLFCSGVIPLIHDLTKQKLMKGCICSLNSVQGNNVRLCVLIHEREKNQALDRFHFGLSTFLSDSPSPNKDIDYPLKEFLKPFPNNSIQYNLYEKPSSESSPAIDFQKVYSAIIFDFFSKNDFSGEASFTLLLLSILYVEETIAKTMNESIYDLIKVCDQYNVNNGDKRTSYELFFQENKNIFLESFLNLFQATAQANTMIDPVHIKKYFKSYFGDAFNSKLKTRSFISSLTDLILYQLDLTSEILDLIYFIIKRCIQNENEFIVNL